MGEGQAWRLTQRPRPPSMRFSDLPRELAEGEGTPPRVIPDVFRPGNAFPSAHSGTFCGRQCVILSVKERAALAGGRWLGTVPCTGRSRSYSWSGHMPGCEVSAHGSWSMFLSPSLPRSKISFNILKYFLKKKRGWHQPHIISEHLFPQFLKGRYCCFMGLSEPKLGGK